MGSKISVSNNDLFIEWFLNKVEETSYNNTCSKITKIYQLLEYILPNLSINNDKKIIIDLDNNFKYQLHNIDFHTYKMFSKLNGINTFFGDLNLDVPCDQNLLYKIKMNINTNKYQKLLENKKIQLKKLSNVKKTIKIIYNKIDEDIIQFRKDCNPLPLNERMKDYANLVRVYPHREMGQIKIQLHIEIRRLNCIIDNFNNLYQLIPEANLVDI